jgi:phospholipid-binding lipoprotein MlaA
MLPTRLLAALLAASLLVGCATRPPADDPEAIAEFAANNDPLEPLNRVLFFVHEGIDTLILRPIGEFYRIVVAPPVRAGVRNALGNLRTPVILLNDLLQGETERAGVTLQRFVINSTLGLGGVLDVAAERGLPAHTEDFGQTLAVWGVREGAYLFIPALGPSTVRDITGFGVDIASNPLTWLVIKPDDLGTLATGARTGLTVADTRESLIEAIDAVRRESLDPYATLRSAYRQRRLQEITNGGQRPAPAAAFGTGFGVGVGATPPAGAR